MKARSNSLSKVPDSKKMLQTKAAKAVASPAAEDEILLKALLDEQQPVDAALADKMLLAQADTGVVSDASAGAGSAAGEAAGTGSAAGSGAAAGAGAVAAGAGMSTGMMAALGVGAIAVAAAVSGGGGGSSSNTPAPTPAPEGSSGVVVDGYLSGATVSRANGSGNTVTTNDTGNFTGLTGTGTIKVTGGTDMLTGQLFTGTLYAPAGSAAVTPLTSLVHALMMEHGFEGGVDAAIAQVKLAFGLPEDFDLLNTDPTTDLDVFKAGVQVATLLQAAAGGDAAVFAALLAVLAEQIAEAVEAVTLDETFISAFVAAAGDLVNLTDDQIAAIVGALEDIADAENIGQVAMAQAAILEDVLGLEPLEPDELTLQDAVDLYLAGTLPLVFTLLPYESEVELTPDEVSVEAYRNLTDVIDLAANASDFNYNLISQVLIVDTLAAIAELVAEEWDVIPHYALSDDGFENISVAEALVVEGAENATDYAYTISDVVTAILAVEDLALAFPNATAIVATTAELDLEQAAALELLIAAEDSIVTGEYTISDVATAILAVEDLALAFPNATSFTANGTEGDDKIDLSSLSVDLIINGGDGADYITGGDGADTFVWNVSSQSAGAASFNDIADDTTALAAGIDVISDFTNGTDFIDLSGLAGISETTTVSFGDAIAETDQGNIFVLKSHSTNGIATGDAVVLINTGGGEAIDLADFEMAIYIVGGASATWTEADFITANVA